MSDTKQKTPVLADQHWRIEDFRQRMTTREWRQVLLDGDDKVTFNGRVRQLVTNDIGAGVLEVFKQPLEAGEPSALTRRTALLREAADTLDKAAGDLEVRLSSYSACEDLAARIRKELGE